MKKSKIWDNVKTLLVAGLIAVVIRSFAFDPFNIPSGSMIPSLLIGDYLFVSKFSYGYSKYSLPFALVPFHGRIFSRSPHQGDVAVFRSPANIKTDYIKRIIGLSGDHIQMVRGILHINDKPVRLARIEDYKTTDKFGRTEYVPQFIETLPNGVQHRILKHDPFGGARYDDTLVYVVPEGHYFMMGDNRDRSGDSRELQTMGYVPIENLIGQAVILFFSVDGTSSWWMVCRILHLID
jgi:signal peptidase I